MRQQAASAWRGGWSKTQSESQQDQQGPPGRLACIQTDWCGYMLSQIYGCIYQS
jgi:hypothetical protein